MKNQQSKEPMVNITFNIIDGSSMKEQIVRAYDKDGRQVFFNSKKDIPANIRKQLKQAAIKSLLIDNNK